MNLYPSFTVHLTCDDNTRGVYFDGFAQPIDSESWIGWDKTTTYFAPANTQYIQIKCENSGQLGGLIVEVGNGVVYDSSWKCSSEGFDSGMMPATEINGKQMPAGISSNARWIWTYGYAYSEDDVVYCQKRLY